MNSLSDGALINVLSNFHFLRPWWLLAIVPFAVIYYLMTKADDLTSQWQSVMSKNMIAHLTVHPQRQVRFTPIRLFSLFALLSTIVMAGPSWNRQPAPFFEDNAELIVALDVSGSMSNTDIQPSRLERAKQKIVQLIDRRGDAKTGLVVYGGSAHVAMPVTKDRALFHYFIDVLDASLLPNQDSNPSSAIGPIVRLLQQSKVPSTVLIVTDKTNSEAIKAMTESFSGLQHQVLVWAIGENPDSGRNGNALTSAQLQDLSQLAQAGHGVMTPFTHNADDVDQVYRNIQSNLFAVDDKASPWVDAGYGLLFFLLPIQLMWFRRGWTLQWK
ncbi:vWA domain-containing protein [Vibrio gallicus]|uniref:vWA domain-containing protein n=1 Tax=Vibrio gallicus TaxID=190897 RepID=UPI0021C2E524|nr:VWA domain-containing protein [Vibrio gallicus]